LAYSTFIPFFTNLSILLRQGFGFSLIESGLVMAAPSIIITFFCPLIGYLSDKFQKRGIYLVIASAISALTQL
jgi:nitrate/nitrite transporter NarK